MVHGHHGLDAGRKHSLPLLLSDLLAVIGSGFPLRKPFLLEIGTANNGLPLLREVVEIVFAHGHADFLAGSEGQQARAIEGFGDAEMGGE